MMKIVKLKTKDDQKFTINIDQIVYITTDEYLGISKIRVSNGDRLIISQDECDKLYAIIEEYEDSK